MPTDDVTNPPMVRSEPTPFASRVIVPTITYGNNSGRVSKPLACGYVDIPRVGSFMAYVALERSLHYEISPGSQLIDLELPGTEYGRARLVIYNQPYQCLTSKAFELADALGRVYSRHQRRRGISIDIYQSVSAILLHRLQCW